MNDAVNPDRTPAVATSASDDHRSPGYDLGSRAATTTGNTFNGASAERGVADSLCGAGDPAAPVRLLELQWRVYARLLRAVLPGHAEPSLDDFEGRVIVTVDRLPEHDLHELVVAVPVISAGNGRPASPDLHILARYRGPLATAETLAGFATSTAGDGGGDGGSGSGSASAAKHGRESCPGGFAYFAPRTDGEGHLLGLDVYDEWGDPIVRCSRGPLPPRSADQRPEAPMRMQTPRWIVWAQCRLPQWLQAIGGQYELHLPSCTFNGVPRRTLPA